MLLLSVSLPQRSVSHTLDSLQNVTIRDVAPSALVDNIVCRMVQRGSGVFISAADVAETTRVLVSVAERCSLAKIYLFI